ncbi:MAG: tRNA (N6-threonylcarbamoyladenosine(37)-N6)-methyltransferase TrmO [Dehalococcoidia bacterium]|jgi:tRNA-Thr(GGU) m(6)t(6)A37 methyltransferase TsaA
MTLRNRFLRFLGTIGILPERIIPTEPIPLKPIGIVRNRVREPRMEGWEDVSSDVIVRKDLQNALDGLEGYSHVVVLFFLHRVSDDEKGRTHCHPRGDERYPLQGVLATRTQHRPNPIGVSVVPLLKRRRNVLRVKGLDAINGTPVLDIKPYLPRYDAPSDVRVPEWVTQQPLPPK